MKRWIVGVGALLAAALMGPGAAMAVGPAPEFKLCTAGKDGRYFAVGSGLRDQTKKLVDIKVLDTDGSMDNLRRMEANECDGAIVQADAHGVYLQTVPGSKLRMDRVAKLYDEYVHLLCNKESGIGSIKTLMGDTKNRVLIGPNGSGSQITWQAFTIAEKRYASVPTDPIGGKRAIGKVADGSDASCMVYVAGLKSQAMTEINDLAKGKVHLVKLNDGDLDNAKDPRGKAVYTYSDIPGGTYPNLQSGFFGSSVKTITVPAILVVNVSWVEANPRAFEDLNGAVLRYAQQLH